MTSDLFQRILLARVTTVATGATSGSRAWLDGALATSDSNALAIAFAVATRRLGTATVELGPDEAAAVSAAGLSWATTATSLDELARILLVLRAATAAGGREGSTSSSSAIAAEWYRQGDNGEKRAVLRALALLPAPETCAEVGMTACRSSVQSVFEALCCENPFPAAHFSELAFNQMVLKALFTGVALARIDRLAERKNPELARMAAGYASERTAAGRSIPADIGDVT